jgi:ribulose-5-phosphate 4-epimerase/fuculose-1-phosphate aldolase
MNKVDKAIRNLVIGNRILAHEGVVDAYGHVSLRHPERPDRFLLSRSRSPELVEPEDIMEFTLDGEPVGGDKRPPYLERFIHGAIYEARPDVVSVVHSHAESVLPFSVSETPLVPIIHSASELGAEVPVWDIADRFGETNLLVTNTAQGRDHAKRLGPWRVALMRGHGFVAAAQTLLQTVRAAVTMPKNARVYTEAMRMGKVKPLSKREIEIRLADLAAETPATLRAWEYWAQRCGCGHLIGDGEGTAL